MSSNSINTTPSPEDITLEILQDGDYNKTWYKNINDTTIHGVNINRNKNYPRTVGDLGFEEKINQQGEKTFHWFVWGKVGDSFAWQPLSPGLQGERGEKGDKGEDSHVPGPAVQLTVNDTEVLYADRKPNVTIGKVSYDVEKNITSQDITFSLPRAYDYKVDAVTLQMLSTDEKAKVEASIPKRVFSDKSTNKNAQWTQDLTFKVPASMNELSENPSVNTIAADQKASVVIGTPTAITSVNNNKTSQSISFNIPRGRQAKLNIKDTIPLDANKNPSVELSATPVDKGIYSEQDLTFKIPKPYNYQLKTKNSNAISMVDTDQSPTITIDNKQGGGSESPNITQDFSIKIPVSQNKIITTPQDISMVLPDQPVSIDCSQKPTVDEKDNPNGTKTSQKLSFKFPKPYKYKLQQGNITALDYNGDYNLGLEEPVKETVGQEQFLTQKLNLKFPAFLNKLEIGTFQVLDNPEAEPSISLGDVSAPSGKNNNITSQKLNIALPRGKFGTIDKITAEINNEEGIPKVNVNNLGPEGHPSLHFTFKNLKGKTPSFKLVDGNLWVYFNDYEGE